MAGLWIDCKYRDDISWIKPDHSLSISRDVHLWKFDYSAFSKKNTEIEAPLAPEEVAKSRRYFRQEDSKRYMLGRYALRMLLAQYLNMRPIDIQFGKHTNGKPFIANSSQKIDFNISHSGKWILLGFSENILGVDVEEINPEFKYQEILPMVLSQKEIEYINNSRDQDREFFLNWTRKEALAKATGLGVTDDLKTVSCLNGRSQIQTELFSENAAWQIESFQVDDKHFASVASAEMLRVHYLLFE